MARVPGFSVTCVTVALAKWGSGHYILCPYVMTSFAFGLGVVPLVTAHGAGAVSRISLGLSVLSGIIASTCLAVLFVPSFFAVLQKLEERRSAKKAPPAIQAATTAK